TDGGIEHDSPWRKRPGGERDRHDAVARSPPEILNHLAVRSLAERDDARHIPRVTPDQYDIAGFDRDISPCSDRDSDIGGKQCGRIVDAIADHSDSLVLGASLCDFRCLLLR